MGIYKNVTILQQLKDTQIKPCYHKGPLTTSASGLSTVSIKY